MKSVVQISDLPNVLSVDELMEVKGGLVDNNKICSLIGSAVKCTVAGSGMCTVAGSGIIIQQPAPNPTPTPGPVTDTNG
jgi:hypothetical protein